MRRRLALGRLDGLRERGYNLEEIARDAVVGHLKDGRVFVLVDGDDALRFLHADQVLDGDASRRVDEEMTAIIFADDCFQESSAQ